MLRQDWGYRLPWRNGVLQLPSRWIELASGHGADGLPYGVHAPKGVASVPGIDMPNVNGEDPQRENQ
jgi:hypothetical protein